MFINNRLTKIWNNREELIIFCCFYGVVCFNIFMLGLCCYELFTYDGGVHNPKSYYEIRTVGAAHTIFLQNILNNWLSGLLFAFPLVWGYFFIRNINLNAVLVQLLPVLIIFGLLLF